MIVEIVAKEGTLATIESGAGPASVPREGETVAFHGKVAGVVERVTWNFTSLGLMVEVKIA